jgi:hypothetical protein
VRKRTVNTVEKNAEDFLLANKETRLEVNEDNNKYMIMSQDRNVGRIHSINFDKISFEMAEYFIYLGTTLTNQNSIQEELINGHVVKSTTAYI